MRVSSVWVAFVALASTPAWADSSWDAYKLVKQGRFDLNGDGKLENVRLEVLKERGSDGKWGPIGIFRLWVNKQSLWGGGGQTIRGFGLADIQKTDGLKEVVVYGQQFDSNSLSIFSFDGHKLRRVEDMGLGDAHFYGDGRVDWTFDAGSFWGATNRYLLRRGHLRLVPRDLYPIGQKATLTQPVVLHRTRWSKKGFKILPKGRFVIVGKGTLNGHYLVRSGRDWGWVTEEQTHSMNGLRFAG